MDSTRLPLTSTRVFAILSCCLDALSRWNEPSEDGKVCKQRDARRQHQSTDVCQGHVPKHSNTNSSLDWGRFVPQIRASVAKFWACSLSKNGSYIFLLFSWAVKESAHFRQECVPGSSALVAHMAQGWTSSFLELLSFYSSSNCCKMSWSSNQSPHHLINKASLSVAQFYFFAPFWFNLLNYCDENPRAHQFQKYSNQSTKNATVRNIEGSQLHEWLTWTFIIYRIVHAVLNCLYFLFEVL